MKNVLVTGGAGAIGGNLVRQLLEDPSCRVVVIDDLSSGFVRNLPLEPERLILIHGSVTDVNVLEMAFGHDIHKVFHLAANFANQNSVDFPERDLLVNGLGTLRLLEFSKRAAVRRFVYTSSSCVYGARDGVLKESVREFSVDTPYAITKLLGEHYVDYFYKAFRLPTAIVRFFNTYGPGEFPGPYRNVIPNFLFRAMRGLALHITGDGSESRDFNYVMDSVRGVILASKCEAAIGDTFNLGSGRETPIRQLAEMVLSLVGGRSRIEYLERRSWDMVRTRRAAIEHSSNILDYRPRVSLEDGLRYTYEWLQKQEIAELMMKSQLTEAGRAVLNVTRV